MKLNFFDCHCMVGKRADRRDSEPWQIESLIKDMTDYDIKDALTVHALSRDYSPLEGNNTIVEIHCQYPQIQPVWAVLPPDTDELQKPDILIEKFFSNNVKAFIAYPKRHNFSLADWSMGSLLSLMNIHHIPLIIEYNETSWPEVYNLCQAYPKIPVIITYLNYRHLRYLLPLWKSCKNLYVDISWFSVSSGLEFLSQIGLIGQVLFGSHYPAYSHSGAISMVTYSGLNNSDKKKVAGDTLREILSATRI